MKRIRLPKILSLDMVINVLAVSMCAYFFAAAFTIIQPTVLHQDTHLCFALLLVFLSFLKGRGKLWPLALPLILLSLVCTGYIWYFYDDLMHRLGVPNTADIIIGIILIVIVWIACKQSFGSTIPILALIFIGYTFLGHYLPDPFWHFPSSLQAVIAEYNMGFKGMFGTPLEISANYVFLLIVFGMLLHASGASQFFIQIGNLVGRRFASGPAMTAVVSSGLVGSITGLGSPNVVLTGSFTIPMMKQAGWRPEEAAGIESAASIGGAIVPPVMGVVAFVMAGFLGVPYIKICAMAVVPAFFYYFNLGLFVQLTAVKAKFKAVVQEISAKAIQLGAPIFLISLICLILLLLSGFTLRFSAAWAIICVVVISLIRKETRGSWREWLRALSEGALLGSRIAVTIALIGIVIASMGVTGLGIKLPSLMETISGGNLWIGLLVTGVIVLILGCGLPPFASYILAAVLCAPALVRMGVPELQAHFFIMFLCAFAHITPPVGVTCIPAAAIANTSYLKTSVQAVKAGAVAWLLPLLAIAAPIIILQPMEPIMGIFMVLATFATILFLQVALVGYYFGLLGVRTRLISAMAVVLFLAFIISENYLLGAAGLVLGILLTLWQLRKRRQLISTP